MLERVSSLSAIIHQSTPLTFGLLTLEGRLLTPYAAYRSKGEGRGATAIIRSVQAENQQLKNLSNPFSQAGSSNTSAAIEAAIALANRSDQFRKGHYTTCTGHGCGW